MRLSDADLDHIRHSLVAQLEALAEALLGAPNRAQSTRQQLRFGTRGSIAVELGRDRGTWCSHETGHGGGFFELVMFATRLDFTGAVKWARDWLRMAPADRLADDEAVTIGLGVCEGIETALAIMQRVGWRPVVRRRRRSLAQAGQRETSRPVSWSDWRVRRSFGCIRLRAGYAGGPPFRCEVARRSFKGRGGGSAPSQVIAPAACRAALAGGDLAACRIGVPKSWAVG